MATHTKDTDHFDDLLTCTICLKIFNVPKYLPCLHTFCESCINTYILSSVEKEKITEGFTCPVCRKIVSVGTTLEKPELLAATLPTNHFVTLMLDKRAIQKAEKMCNSCQLNKESTEAKSWCPICEEAFCDQCEKYHKTFKISARHKLFNIQEMQSGSTPFEVCRVQGCEEHPEKIVEFYCLDHSQPCCTSCATLSHHKCENVTSIQKAASGIKQSTKASGLSQRLRKHVNQLSEVIDNRNKNFTDVDNSIEEIQTRLADMKIEISKHINRIETALKVELISSKKQINLKLKDEVDIFSSYRSAVKNWKAVLDSVLEHGSEQQCLMEIIKIEPKIFELEQEIDDSVKNIKSVSVVFNPSSPIAGFVKNVETFGTIQVNESAYLGNFRTGNVRILKVIDVCNGRGSSSGIFLENCLLFTIRQKKKVVKYSRDGKSLLSELALQCDPQDIAKIKKSEVAVSSSEKVVYIVDNDKMTLLQTLPLPGIPVYGLCFVNEEQFITGHSSTLTWINVSSGQKVNQRTTNGQSLFVLSIEKYDYIHADGRKINYVVGNATKFTYTHDQLVCPRGIGIDFAGNIYIAGYNSMNIHQITNEGQLIRIIPAKVVGLEYPWTIRFAPKCNKFIVTCNTSGKAVLCEIA
ncbi:TRIM56 [Mytilus coruscus]|uniref:TRIM56 n=1 Tax=Mytilus coruscus TaxID=42192 RepID=A0A6J8CF03_MYTCO|nr:TRIM56 [Mytilus coruscus]